MTADPLEILVLDARVPGADELVAVVGNLRRREIRPLEQAVRGVADFDSAEAAGRHLAARGAFAHPGNALREEAVRAALVKSKRRVRELSHLVERRRRNRKELG